VGSEPLFSENSDGNQIARTFKEATFLWLCTDTYVFPPNLVNATFARNPTKAPTKAL
jgi:hypothetical protein